MNDVSAQTFGDNQGGITFANSSVSSKMMRHIDIKQHFTRDAVLKCLQYTVYIGREDQHADMLDKPRNVKLLGKHAGAMNVG